MTASMRAGFFAILGSVLSIAAGPAAPGRLSLPRYLRDLHLPASNDAFKTPFSVHADLHTGEIFVSDRAEGRITIFDRLGIFRYAFSGGSRFESPSDLAVDPEGYIFVLGRLQDRTVLLHLDFDGKRIGEIGLTGLPQGVSDVSIGSVALSPSGERLYLVDQLNRRLWIATRDGALVGSTDLAAGLSEKEAREQIFGHVDVYGDSVLVALPMLGVVRVLGLDGRPRADVGIKGTLPCQTAFPVAGALDRDGNVVVLDQQRMSLTVWSPERNVCLMDYTAGGEGPGQFYLPADLALDAFGKIIVSQGFQGRVQMLEYGTPAPEPPPTGAPSP